MHRCMYVYTRTRDHLRGDSFAQLQRLPHTLHSRYHHCLPNPITYHLPPSLHMRHTVNARLARVLTCGRAARAAASEGASGASTTLASPRRLHKWTRSSRLSCPPAISRPFPHEYRPWLSTASKAPHVRAARAHRAEQAGRRHALPSRLREPHRSSRPSLHAETRSSLLQARCVALVSSTCHRPYSRQTHTTPRTSAFCSHPR